MPKLCVAVALCVFVSGCGSKSSTTTSNPVSISLVPGTATVQTATTQQFTATVTNATNTAVTYEVNNVVGGSATTGTISTAGLYTAPTQVPNPNTVEIEAISQQDNTQKAVAEVTIAAPPPTTHIDISPPPPIVIPAGGIQTFTAAINGQAATVTWTASCAAGTTIACGSIGSSSGVYTAPLSPPPGGTVTITATVTSGDTPPATTTATVQFSNGTLVGQYAFSVLGTGMAMAGSLTFNGNGCITSGSGDLNTGGAVSSFTLANASPCLSTYTVQTDGHGVNLVLNTAGGATYTFAFALLNHSHGYLTRFDSGAAAATGALDLQDPTQFNIAALNGPYTLAFANHGASLAAQLAAAGAFITNGAAGFSGGELDVNSAGTPSSGLAASGSIGAPSSTTGRGTLSLSSSAGTQNFAYYLVDATHLKLLQLDAPAAAGDVYRQSGSGFSLAGFTGPYAAILSGFTAGGAVGEGGVFTLDGAGGVKSVAVDVNQAGTTLTNSSAGSYTAPDSDGRTVITIGSLVYAAYPQASGALNLVEIDSTNNAAGGTAYPQQPNAFSNTSITGNFALSASGIDLSHAHAEEDAVGLWHPLGGTTFSGLLDVNDNGAVSESTSLTGSYNIAISNGRAQSGNLQAGNFPSGLCNFYVVNANTVLFLETDSNRVLTGIMQKQY
ncbi:MAG: hypothetical protein JO041_03965 [Acidobacteria bacterium]|nr:hypothetical protein [Acidobacteriota bacterium]